MGGPGWWKSCLPVDPPITTGRRQRGVDPWTSSLQSCEVWVLLLHLTWPWPQRLFQKKKVAVKKTQQGILFLQQDSPPDGPQGMVGMFQTWLQFYSRLYDLIPLPLVFNTTQHQQRDSRNTISDKRTPGSLRHSKHRNLSPCGMTAQQPATKPSWSTSKYSRWLSPPSDQKNRRRLWPSSNFSRLVDKIKTCAPGDVRPQDEKSPSSSWIFPRRWHLATGT